MTDDEATLKMVEPGEKDDSVYDPRYLSDFESRYRRHPAKTGVKKSLKSWARKSCSKKAVMKSILGNFPFVKIMRGYKLLKDLPKDIIAGMMVGIMQIPQSNTFITCLSLHV